MIASLLLQSCETLDKVLAPMTDRWSTPQVKVNKAPMTDRWSTSSVKEKDINWYKASAKAGSSSSQYLLGNVYFKSKKYYEAKRHFTQAANQNHSDSQFKLALMYHLGLGTKDGAMSRKNSTKKWLEKAKSNGNLGAAKAWKQLKIYDYYCIGGYCY